MSSVSPRLMDTVSAETIAVIEKIHLQRSKQTSLLRNDQHEDKEGQIANVRNTQKKTPPQKLSMSKFVDSFKKKLNMDERTPVKGPRAQSLRLFRSKSPAKSTKSRSIATPSIGSKRASPKQSNANKRVCTEPSPTTPMIDLTQETAIEVIAPHRVPASSPPRYHTMVHNYETPNNYDDRVQTDDHQTLIASPEEAATIQELTTLLQGPPPPRNPASILEDLVASPGKHASQAARVALQTSRKHSPKPRPFGTSHRPFIGNNGNARMARCASPRPIMHHNIYSTVIRWQCYDQIFRASVAQANKRLLSTNGRVDFEKLTMENMAIIRQHLEATTHRKCEQCVAPGAKRGQMCRVLRCVWHRFCVLERFVSSYKANKHVIQAANDNVGDLPIAHTEFVSMGHLSQAKAKANHVAADAVCFGTLFKNECSGGQVTPEPAVTMHSVFTGLPSFNDICTETAEQQLEALNQDLLSSACFLQHSLEGATERVSRIAARHAEFRQFLLQADHTAGKKQEQPSLPAMILSDTSQDPMQDDHDAKMRSLSGSKFRLDDSKLHLKRIDFYNAKEKHLSFKQLYFYVDHLLVNMPERNISDNQVDGRLEKACNSIWNWHKGSNKLRLSSTHFAHNQPIRDGSDCLQPGMHPLVHAIITKIRGVAWSDFQTNSDCKTRTLAAIGVECIEQIFPAQFPGMTVPLFEQDSDTATVAKESLLEISKKAVDKVVASLIETMQRSFEIVGAGLDCKAQGLVLSPFWVELIEVNMSGVGWENPSIRKSSTGRLPLFHRKTAEKLCGNNNAFFEELCALIYDSTELSQVSDDVDVKLRSLPPGFDMLCTFYCAGDKNKFAPSWNGVLHVNDPVEYNALAYTKIDLWMDVLADDTNALTFVTTLFNDSPSTFSGAIFVRVGKNDPGYIEREYAVLRELSHDSIPKILRTGMLEIEAHGMTAARQAIVLRGNPVGIDSVAIPITSCLEKIFTKGYVNAVVKSTQNALMHAHEKGWTNQILGLPSLHVRFEASTGGGESCHVLIMSWTNAMKVDEVGVLSRQNLSCARGSTIDDRLHKVTQIADKENDLLALAFVTARLLHRTDRPWPSFWDKKSSVEKICKERYERTASLIEQHSGMLDMDMHRSLKSYLGIEESCLRAKKV